MFLINLQGKDSIYAQIRDQILRFIETGVLTANDKLPSVRQLAQELGINPNTVQKAYQELEKDGYIYTLSKKGAFVAKQDVDLSGDLLKRDFIKNIKQYRLAGIEKKTLIDWLDDAYKEE